MPKDKPSDMPPHIERFFKDPVEIKKRIDTLLQFKKAMEERDRNQQQASTSKQSGIKK